MNLKLNLNFDLYKGTTRLKQWWKEVKAHFTEVQEAHNALDTTVSTHKTAAIIDHPDESITTEKIADESITTEKIADESITLRKLSLDILKEIAKIPKFLYYEAEPVYLSGCEESSLGYELPADIPANVLFILENDTDSSLSEFRTHDDYYTPLSCKIPSGETRICILLKRASGGADPQNGYLFVLDDTDTKSLINKETLERKNTDTTLQQNIDTEAVNRQTADNALDGRIAIVEGEAHTHANKTVLDGITAEDILNWNDKITYEPATSSANGLMSAEDKAKLDGIAEGATKTVVDDALNVTSTNPLQNKVVTTELKKKVSVYKVSGFLGADTYYRLPFEVGEYFILKNDGTEDISKLLYGYNESWYNPSVYYWFSNTIKAGNTALCYMTQAVVDAGDIDGHDGTILTYELNESFAQILQNQSKITELQQETEEHITQTPDTDGGVHGVRAEDGKIEIFDGRNFVEMQKAYKTYGVSIDLTNSDPEAAVTYTDDAVGMVAGSSDWDNTNIFRDIRPCLFKDGAVVGYLDPDDFSKFADGTDADITSGDAGDVMIEIPKVGVKIATSGDTLTVQVTDDPNAEGFSYLAHTRQTMGDRDKLYIGVFLGYDLSSALRSLSGKMPTTNITIGETRTLAQANGEGYDQIAFYQLTLLQCLFIIKYKNRDSQTALGMGYTTPSNASAVQTGGTVAKGMDFGETTGQQQMKFLGIEDFWDNLFYWIDGFVSSSDYHALTATDNFNDTGDGYTDQGALSTSNISGYMKAPQGTNELGFTIKEVGGSSTTYFADYANFYGGYVPYFGGSWTDGLDAGSFGLFVHVDASYCDVCGGGRLMYL